MKIELEQYVDRAVDVIKQQMERRSYLVANELRNNALQVLRGQRSGRRYKVPGTYRRQRDKTDGKMKNGRYYTASAPGEPPAVRTGTFRLSWQATANVVYGSYYSRIESDLRTESGGKYTLGEILENGTSRMAPRPYQDEILEKTKPYILRIYGEGYYFPPYFQGDD